LSGSSAISSIATIVVSSQYLAVPGFERARLGRQ
jgi:hypothetical protein